MRSCTRIHAMWRGLSAQCRIVLTLVGQAVSPASCGLNDLAGQTACPTRGLAQKLCGIGLSAGRDGIRAAIGFDAGRDAGQRPAPRPVFKSTGILACVVAFLLAGSAYAAVDGTVVNRTTGKPQPGATVTLFKFGSAGPEALASVQSDAGGKFRIPQDLPQGPSLIETAYQSVTYNRMLEPGGAGSNLELEVFETSRRPSSARVAQHMVVLEPQGPQLSVSETFFFSNSGKLTYHDPASGTLRFFLPEAVQGQARVMVTAPQGMPIQRAPGRTSQPNLYKLDFPIKPGETRIELSYTAALAEPATFSGKMFYPGVPTRLAVPNGMALLGEGLESLGREPSTQAAIYEVRDAAYTVQIQGVGAAAEDSGPSIEEILPRVYDHLGWILVPTFLALLLGFILLYRSRAPAKGNRQG